MSGAGSKRRLAIGFLSGAVLGGLVLPALPLLLGALSETRDGADTAFGWSVLFGSSGALGLSAGFVAGRFAGRYEPAIAALSVLVGVASSLAIVRRLAAPLDEGGIEPLPFVAALAIGGFLPVLLAALGGLLAARLRRRGAGG